ncbi:hypothetical protein COTS27_00169 [Spirochaetota bacterium]|nr:hypothetical protein COTS27_00169 [Spirochaetota bacterium]
MEYFANRTAFIGLLLWVSCIGVRWNHGYLLAQLIDLPATKSVIQHDNTRRDGDVQDASTVGALSFRHGISADVPKKSLSHSNPFLPVTLEALSEPKPLVLKKTALSTKTKLKVVFLIDNSKSMVHNDPENHRFYSVIELFKTDVVRRNVDEAAVIVFSNEAQVLIPFTAASNVTSRLKKNLASNKVNFFSQGKTDINAPFEILKKELLTRDKLAKVKKQLAVIFLSDGVATLPYEQTHLFLQKHHIPIFTIGYNIFKASQQTKQLAQTTNTSSVVQKTSSSHPQPNNDFNEKFLRVLAESTADNKGRTGQYLAASEKSIFLVYRELFQTMSKRLTSLRISILKKTYAPNELLVFRYGFVGAGTNNNFTSTDHLALRNCYVTGDAVLYADSAEVGYSNIETLRSVEQVKYLATSTSLTRFNRSSSTRSKIVAKRESHKKANLPEIMFYPLPQGRYNVTVRVKCGTLAEAKQTFTITFTETALPLQITDTLYFTTGAPYPKEDYFNVYAYKDLSVLGIYYHLAEVLENKGYSPVQKVSPTAYKRSFAVSFPESRYLLRAGEHKLQSYRIASRPNDLLDDMSYNKNRYHERLSYHDNSSNNDSSNEYSSNEYSSNQYSGSNGNNENVFAEQKFSVPLTHHRTHHPISNHTHTKPKVITASSSSSTSLKETSATNRARSEHGFIEIVTSEGRYLYHTFIEMTSASREEGEGFMRSALIKPVQRYYSPMQKGIKNSSARGYVRNHLVLQLTLGILIGMMISVGLIGLRYLRRRAVRSPSAAVISYLSKK